MISSELIILFELQVSDVTELSTSEELIILNRVNRKVCNKQPWEFLKTTGSGTVVSDATGSYIALPADFNYFIPDTYWNDNGYSPLGTVYSGSSKSPYQIIKGSETVNYINRSGYAYIDGTKLRFTYTPVSTAITFPYIKVPATLTINSTPEIPTQFQEVLVFAMATENDILQLSPKAKSYEDRNEARYQEYLLDLKYWNSQFII